MVSSDKDSLEIGDTFVAKTVSRHRQSHETPSWATPTDECAVVKNPVSNDPYWIKVKNGRWSTEYKLEVTSVEGVIECEILEGEHNPRDYDPFESDREERIGWTGSDQGKPNQSHNRIISEEDVRGSKNDFTKGLR